jgi:hypothetical protein
MGEIVDDFGPLHEKILRKSVRNNLIYPLDC